MECNLNYSEFSMNGKETALNHNKNAFVPRLLKVNGMTDESHVFNRRKVFNPYTPTSDDNPMQFDDIGDLEISSSSPTTSNNTPLEDDIPLEDDD